MKLPKEELDKLVELFRAGDIQLSIQICEGLDYDYVDVLRYVLGKSFHEKTNYLNITKNVTLWYWRKDNYYDLYDHSIHDDIFSDMKTLDEALTKLYKYLKEQ